VNILKHYGGSVDATLDAIGAQTLAGSGFENEIPDADFADSQETAENEGGH